MIVSIANTTPSRNQLSPLPSLNDKAPSQVEESDVQKQKDVRTYSPCSSLFLLKCFLWIYQPIESYVEEFTDLHDLVKICFTNFQRALSGSDSFGYCSMKSMVEEGITSIFAANLTTLFIAYKFKKSKELDRSITIMHQSYNQGEKKYGLNDLAIYYQFQSNDNYCFKGYRGLFPMIFMELTKSTTKPLDKKLPQSSLYANYFFRQQIIGKSYTNHIPLLGITYTESNYIIILYSFTIHDQKERISETILATGLINENFLYLIIPLFDNYIQLCCGILKSNSYLIPHSFNPIPNQTIIKLDDFYYKSYDYRQLSNQKHLIPFHERRGYQGYKFSRLNYQIVLFYQDPENQADSLAIIKYPEIPGNHKPAFVLHFINILEELLLLHSKLIVFGDIRLSNMIFITIPNQEELMKPSKSYAYLIDFDLVGVEGERIYPSSFNINIGDAIRHPEAVPQNQMKTIHDCYSFASICEYFKIQSQNVIENNRWEEAIEMIRNGLLHDSIELLKLISSCSVERRSETTINVKDLFATGSPNKK